MHAPKKNVSIEIRLPDEAKTAFMARCLREDCTASEAIRAFIDDQLNLNPKPSIRRSAIRLVSVALFGAALGAGVAAPSLAHSITPLQTSCAQIGSSHIVLDAAVRPSH